MIYLDTHVVVWLYAYGSQRLSERAAEIIEESEQLLISPMVLLELEFLHEIQKINVGCHTIYEYLNERIFLEVCTKEFPEVIQRSMLLSWTRDTFDRIITAQAALKGNILITKDRAIHNHYNEAIW